MQEDSDSVQLAAHGASGPSLSARNFRSLRSADFEFAPITLLYGPSGGGKSSVMYSLLSLKNVIANPNQVTSGFFNYSFASLGSFDSVVFDHDPDSFIQLGFSVYDTRGRVTYAVAIGDASGELGLEAELDGEPLVLNLRVPFPYPTNLTTSATVRFKERDYTVNWNGFVAQIANAADSPADANELATLLNRATEELRGVSHIPVTRGFFKPTYTIAAVTASLTTDDEVATVLANDKYLTQKVSFYLEQVHDRDFRISSKIGTSVFSLDTTNNSTRTSSDLVNEGFGINQTAFILAKTLHKDARIVSIEEPEIHLNPTAVRRFMHVLLRIVKDENRRFVISTHSEAVIAALLGAVARSDFKASEIACYFMTKPGRETTVQRQVIRESGQIEGGLKTFAEAELEDLKALLHV
jgi:predicted ATPase